MANSSNLKIDSTFSFLIMLVVVFIIGCGAHKHLTGDMQANLQHDVANKPMLTVFIHGTRIFPKFALQEGFYSDPGLIKISELNQSYHTMHMIAKELERLDPQRFCCERFYAFGWSGKLDFDARRETARMLYEQLKKVVDEYAQTHGARPRLRLITHSHGGNVALNLATVKDQQNTLKIDELILLACPVQEETKHLLNDPMFGKKYSLCSAGDLIQLIDPQGLQCKCSGSVFSGRWFPCYPQVVQTKIKIGGRAIIHTEFILQRFIKRLPEILDVMDSWNEQIKVAKNQVQSQPFPVIDLRARSVRLHGWRHLTA